MLTVYNFPNNHNPIDWTTPISSFEISKFTIIFQVKCSNKLQCQSSCSVSGAKSFKMSARKLCSILVRSSNSSFLPRCKHLSSNPKASIQILQQQSVNYSQALGSLTKDQAHDLVYRLNDDERVVLMRTLEQFNVSREKDGLECKWLICCCASTWWMPLQSSWQAGVHPPTTSLPLKKSFCSFATNEESENFFMHEKLICKAKSCCRPRW